MQRVGALATLARNVAIDLFGKGKHGFKPGNAVSGEVPTTPGYEFFNAIQEELASVVEDTGDVLEPGKNNQVLAAIKKLIGHFDVNDPHPVYAKKVEFQQDLYSSAIASGTADAIVSAFTPAFTAATLAAGCPTVSVRATAANATTTPTHTPNQGVVPAAPIVKGVNQPLAIGDIAGAGYLMTLQWDATLSKWVLLNPATGVSGTTTVTPASDPAFADNSAKSASTSWLRGAMSAIATAAGFACSLGANGYLKLPSWLGGVIFQWGTNSTEGSIEGPIGAVTFPIAFPNAVLGFAPCTLLGAWTAQNLFNKMFQVQAISNTSVTFYLQDFGGSSGSGSVFVRWIAIGN